MTSTIGIPIKLLNEATVSALCDHAHMIQVHALTNAFDS